MQPDAFSAHDVLFSPPGARELHGPDEVTSPVVELTSLGLEDCVVALVPNMVVDGTGIGMNGVVETRTGIRVVDAVESVTLKLKFVSSKEGEVAVAGTDSELSGTCHNVLVTVASEVSTSASGLANDSSSSAGVLVERMLMYPSSTDAPPRLALSWSGA
jgi:hypothetical protein